jgi:hypothetical protein
MTSPYVERWACTRTAPRRVRQWVAERLGAALPGDRPVPADRLEDIAFCVAELVTMSVLAECATVELRLAVERSCVRVTVLDDGPLPRERVAPAAPPDQLGLRVISTIADRYGVDPTDGRHGRWLEFDLAPVGPNDLDAGTER